MDNFYAMLVDYESKSCPGKMLGLFSTDMMNPKSESDRKSTRLNSSHW